jgi:hypothetical protein
MTEYWITFKLLSDATFGRGEGIAGLLDREVEHDAYGLPFLRGRTLKGLISEEADNIRYALGRMNVLDPQLEEARLFLFGKGGSAVEDSSRIRFGNAELPAYVRSAVIEQAQSDNASQRLRVLESLTTVRRQTAIEEAGERYGVPVEGSLRTMRTILRQTPFEARLVSERDLNPTELGLLAVSVMAFRRAGTGRNRGRGRLEADLLGRDRKSLLSTSYDEFMNAIDAFRSVEAEVNA